MVYWGSASYLAHGKPHERRGLSLSRREAIHTQQFYIFVYINSRDFVILVLKPGFPKFMTEIYDFGQYILKLFLPKVSSYHEIVRKSHRWTNSMISWLLCNIFGGIFSES